MLEEIGNKMGRDRKERMRKDGKSARTRRKGDKGRGRERKEER